MKLGMHNGGGMCLCTRVKINLGFYIIMYIHKIEEKRYSHVKENVFKIKVDNTNQL